MGVQMSKELIEKVSKVDLKNEIDSALIKMINGLDDGVSFLGAELPDYINQLLMWNLVENLFYFILGIAITVLTAFLYKAIWNNVEDSETATVSCALASFLLIPAAICVKPGS